MTPGPDESDADAATRALLDRRAERLGRRVVEVEGSVAWVAEFACGDERYAVELDHLRAALPLRAVTPVPLAPPHVIGILRFQGQILTAMSLAALLGGRGWRDDPAVLLVVDPGDGRRVALDCEQVPRPVAVPRAAYEAARAQSRGAVVDVALEGSRVGVIDLRRLLASASGQPARGG